MGCHVCLGPRISAPGYYQPSNSYAAFCLPYIHTTNLHLGTRFCSRTVSHCIFRATSSWQTHAVLVRDSAFLLLLYLGRLWPPSSDLIDAGIVVYIIWSPWSRLLYIGKTIDFRERIRRHLRGLLQPESAHPQPYMSTESRTRKTKLSRLPLEHVGTLFEIVQNSTACARLPGEGWCGFHVDPELRVDSMAWASILAAFGLTMMWQAHKAFIH